MAAAGDIEADSQIQTSRPTSLPGAEYTTKGFSIGCGFYNQDAMFPDLKSLVEPHICAMREEALKLAGVWTPWPETKLYKAEEGAQWKVMPFCYSFPSNDPSATRWVEPAKVLCPTIWSVLKSVPGLRTALLSRMGPGTRLAYHQGWAELANHVLRVHVGLHIPGDGRQCGVAVEDVHQHHVQDGLLCFDDSRKHMAYNLTDEDRYVLIFDVERPAYVPVGSAHLGRTDELDAFIEYFEAGMRRGAEAARAEAEAGSPSEVDEGGTGI